jgi:hypothetical protein
MILAWNKPCLCIAASLSAVTKITAELIEPSRSFPMWIVRVAPLRHHFITQQQNKQQLNNNFKQTKRSHSALTESPKQPLLQNRFHFTNILSLQNGPSPKLLLRLPRQRRHFKLSR